MDMIKTIIDRRYKALTLSILGKQSLTRAQINELRRNGIEVPEKPSLIELAYYHSLLVPRGVSGPTSVEDMKLHQEGNRPSGEAHDYAKEHSNESMKLNIENMKQDATTRILGLVQDNNQKFKFATMKNATQTQEVQKLLKESSVSQLKQRLRDSSGDANRNWARIAVTEVANSISMGAADRVISQNPDKSGDDIYVYKIPVNDAKLCSACRKFYLDSDGSPKLYKLSTLLSNGSNTGKPRSDWLPTVGPAHPNDRESGIIELKRGWKLLPGGKQTYIGSEGWNEYIFQKLTN